jgi:hypothetical protein
MRYRPVAESKSTEGKATLFVCQPGKKWGERMRVARVVGAAAPTTDPGRLVNGAVATSTQTRAPRITG